MEELVSVPGGSSSRRDDTFQPFCVLHTLFFFFHWAVPPFSSGPCPCLHVPCPLPPVTGPGFENPPNLLAFPPVMSWPSPATGQRNIPLWSPSGSPGAQCPTLFDVAPVACPSCCCFALSYRMQMIWRWGGVRLGFRVFLFFISMFCRLRHADDPLFSVLLVYLSCGPSSFFDCVRSFVFCPVPATNPLIGGCLFAQFLHQLPPEARCCSCVRSWSLP